MKNFTNIRFWLLAGIVGLGSCLAFSACDDDDDPTYAHAQAAEVEAAGTYVGTFTRIRANSATAVEEYGEGTLVIADSTAHVVKLTFTCADLNIATASIPVNISFANAGYQFSNYGTSNPTGAPIIGNISGEHELETSFQLKIRKGFNTTTYDISFTGKRVD